MRRDGTEVRPAWQRRLGWVLIAVGGVFLVAWFGLLSYALVTGA